jgi:hypothetical protein
MEGILGKLGQTWPVKLAESIYGAFALPGQVASGVLNVPPSRPGMWSDMDEAKSQATQGTMMNRAADLGGLVMGGGFGMAPAGAVGSSGARVGSKLPMDEASRMGRAQEQGYTRDAYRGEGRPIDGESFIQGHPHRHDSGWLGGDAIYSTNRPHLANDYATIKAARERIADEAPNVMPLKVKMENPLIITGDDKRRMSGLSSQERDDWLRAVYAKGHDGVIVKYGDGNPARRTSGYEEYAAPAQNYRSRFAAFDPANAGSGNLLGAGHPLAALLMQATQAQAAP